ncbi:MAG: glycosyltransferase family 39 protein, partial [Ferruginibacter sp.]|nr:glycosyltransferase family 39 protein [Chitinophagaceae bacterium]
GLLSFHGFATGDPDATLCLWITIYSGIVLDKIILPGEKPDPKWIYFTGLFFLLAFLTKSTAAFLPLPGLLFSVFLFNKQKWLFLNKHFYIMCLLVILLIIGYYFMMEIRRPGYFHHAWDSEYKRIYTNIMPWHTQPFGYYFKNLSTRFFPWCWVLIPSIIVGLRSKTIFIKQLTVFSSVFSISYLLIISIPAVKLEWYDIPVYPFLAVLSSVIFFEVSDWLKSTFSNRRIALPAFFSMFIIITATTLISIVNRIIHPPFKEPLEREGIAMRQLMKEPVINSLKILMRADHPEHYNQINFYREMYLAKKGYRPDIRYSLNELVPGDSVLTCQLPKEDSLSSLKVETIKKINDCFLIHILKNPEFPRE